MAIDTTKDAQDTKEQTEKAIGRHDKTFAETDAAKQGVTATTSPTAQPSATGAGSNDRTLSNTHQMGVQDGFANPYAQENAPGLIKNQAIVSGQVQPQQNLEQTAETTDKK